MFIKNSDTKKIVKNILLLIFSVILIWLGLRLAVFYMPFVIAFALYFMIEPIIKFCMNKLKLKRKTSSLLILVLVLSAIVGLLVWGIVTIVTEASSLLSNLNEYINLIYSFIQDKLREIDFNKLQLSEQMKGIVSTSTQDLLVHVSDILKNFFTGLLEKLTSIPTIAFYIVITIMSLYFISTDKIYMIDQLEHHLPQNWVRKINLHVQGIVSSLGAYLKAQIILVGISFVISVIGLFIYSFIWTDIKYPLLVALGIAFVDALPILGSGMVMVPWAMIAACKGNISMGIAIVILWLIMTISRQMIEPKVVGGQVGIHPIFTIIAMYTGFKLKGVIGLFLGPIILIILKNIFENTIDKGLVKSIME